MRLLSLSLSLSLSDLTLTLTKVMLYAGCTVESSSDPALSVCAERTTLLKVSVSPKSGSEQKRTLA